MLFPPPVPKPRTPWLRVLVLTAGVSAFVYAVSLGAMILLYAAYHDGHFPTYNEVFPPQNSTLK